MTLRPLLALSGLLVGLLAVPAGAQAPIDPTQEAEASTHGLEVRIGADDDLPQEIIDKLDPEQLAAVLMAREHSDSFDPEAVFVPLAFFLFLGTAIFLNLYFRARQVSEQQQSLRLMIEKGAEISPELLNPPTRRGSDQRRGLVLMAFGFGSMIFLELVAGERGVWSLGLIPTLIGAAYLAVWKLEARQRAAGAE